MSTDGSGSRSSRSEIVRSTALKELEFDHRTGKVSDEDYRALVAPLARRGRLAR